MQILSTETRQIGRKKTGEQPKKRIALRELHSIKKSLRTASLHSVCEEARCPNRTECFSSGTATFLAMGNICTRRCAFCSIATGKPLPLDPNEPDNILNAARQMRLQHVVITSVDRDELADGGAQHLALILRKLHTEMPDATTEILTPDFKGDFHAVDCIVREQPAVFNHNLETVPSLYATVRPGAKVQRSLDVLKYAAKADTNLTKTGLMLGLGEKTDELKAMFESIAETGIDILTLGQYFQPTKKQLPVVRYLQEEEFAAIGTLAERAGIPYVYSGVFVRSSYNASDVLKRIRIQKTIQR